VVAVDQAPSMVAAARELLGERAEVRQADLATLSLPEPVDAAFSNAVFHWVADHDALFAALRRALRPGWRLVAQCGGEGNVARFHRCAAQVAARDPYAAHLGGWEGPWNFQGAQATAARLEAAGFTDVDCWLEPWPVTPPDPPAFLRSVCLGYHLARLPEQLREPYIADVLAALGDPVQLDYVRLNIAARRPGA
jgi:trans-aconitate 2-methyltransferase